MNMVEREVFPDDDLKSLYTRVVSFVRGGDVVAIVRFEGVRFRIDSNDDFLTVQDRFIKAHNAIAMLVH